MCFIFFFAIPEMELSLGYGHGGISRRKGFTINYYILVIFLDINERSNHMKFRPSVNIDLNEAIDTEESWWRPLGRC